MAAATTSLVAAPTSLATNPATRPSQPVTYTAEVGGAYQITHPGQPWPGVDDWSCQPSPEHPRPVILLHGTGANGVNNWGTIAPALLNEGYCVFAPTYGATPLFPGIGATLRMTDHVDEMTAYLDRVLDATGADQADVVGHSQGVTVGMHLAKVTRPDRISTVAAEQGRRVRYITTAALVNELVEAADDKQLSRVVGRYARLDLLCLDEVGYVHLDPRGAELLFQIITAREERASIACASNAPFSEWGTTFTDPRLAAAVVDRLTYNAHIIQTGTASYRLAATAAHHRKEPATT